MKSLILLMLTVIATSNASAQTKEEYEKAQQGFQEHQIEKKHLKKQTSSIINNSAYTQSAREAFEQATAKRNKEIQEDTKERKEIYRDLKALHYLEKEELLLNAEMNSILWNGSMYILQLRSDLIEWQEWSVNPQKDDSSRITGMSSSKIGYTTNTNNDPCQVTLTYWYNNTGRGDYSLTLHLGAVCIINGKNIEFKNQSDLRNYMTMGPAVQIETASGKQKLREFIKKHPKSSLIKTVPDFVFVE